jgi:hypothetical protein
MGVRFWLRIAASVFWLALVGLVVLFFGLWAIPEGVFFAGVTLASWLEVIWG